ncbi:MAG: hypothetical protein GXP28_04495 [Planctomycetes bacterium]|nr:hypothetical protein [Planctomycetota bacterium]
MTNAKPDKPTPDFPLFAHTRGYWAKNIDGKQKGFWKWDDPEGALATYLCIHLSAAFRVFAFQRLRSAANKNTRNRSKKRDDF